MRDSGKNATYSNNIRIAQKSVAKICFLILPESAVSDRNGACPGGGAKLGEGGRKVLFDSKSDGPKAGQTVFRGMGKS